MSDRFTLAVTFKSNEHPWQTIYDPSPYGPENDDDAIKWATGMMDGLGSCYACTLLKNGRPVTPPTTKKE